MGPVTARCQCGQLTATCAGEPLRISVCHCHDCQRRSGSAFATQIRFLAESVTVSGEHHSWARVGDSGGKAIFHFCPTCGSSVFYDIEGMPEVRVVALGAFAGAELPAPWVSVYEERKLGWVEINGDPMERYP